MFWGSATQFMCCKFFFVEWKTFTEAGGGSVGEDGHIRSVFNLVNKQL